MHRKISRQEKLKKHLAPYKNAKPCTDCRFYCIDSSVSCKLCRNFCHAKCLGISKKALNQLEDTDTYICAKCMNSLLPLYDIDNIDFMSALFGEGLYPCKKCKRDCLDNMNCIQCSACSAWHHQICTKLDDEQFKTIKYFFCNKRCEKSVEIPNFVPENPVENCADTQNAGNPEKMIKKKQKPARKISVLNHFLDIKCSYLESNDLVDSHLSKIESELVISHNNAESLGANFHKIEDEVFVNCTKYPEILAITETRLHKDSLVPQLEGYKFKGVHSRCTKNHKGGVGVYISNQIEYSIRDDLSLNLLTCEDIWLNVTVKANNTPNCKKPHYENLVVGVIYRHPDNKYSAFSESLSKSLHILNENKSNYVLVGDFNINAEKYSVASYATNFLNCTSSLGCNLFINKPTRVTKNSSSIVDHVYSNLPTCNLENYVVKSDVSDHYGTLTKIKGYSQSGKHEKIYRRKTKLSAEEWARFNVELNALLSKDLPPDDQKLDINSEAKAILEAYQKLLDKYMPLKRLTRKQTRFYHKPWLTPAIQVSIIKKNRLHKIAKRKNASEKSIREYKTYRNLLTRTKANAYDNYYREKLALYGQDKAKTWRLINEITKRKRNNKTSVKNIIDKDGKKFDKPKDVANTLNAHFSTVGKTMAEEYDKIEFSDLRDPLEYVTRKESIFRNLSLTNLSEILQLIGNLDPKKSCGFDLISNKILKSTASTIAPFLVTLFNKCLKNGTFPDCYKTAKVTPLFKGGDKQDPDCYRPISLLPCVGKLFEKVIATRLLEYFNTFDLFSKYQFGFRESFTTEFAILDIYEKLLYNVDKGLVTCSIFLDLSKAFDSVSHKILLRKLEKYGLQGSALKLFKSYLFQRHQFVCMNDNKSDLSLIEYGVPQGSILGPLLFLIYINDLPEVTNFFIKLYADDTFLCAQNENIVALEAEVNEELDKVYKWLASNKLTLNVKKSKFMITTRQKCANNAFSVKLSGFNLEQCDSYKYLGVYFDRNLNWATHIDYVSQKISKACGCLARLRKCVDLEVMREVYHALLHSYLRYGIIVWGTAATASLQPLRVIMNRAIRIMCSTPLGKLDVEPLFEIIGILNIDQIYSVEVAKFMHKEKSNSLPVSIAEYFSVRASPAHHYNLRARNTTRDTILNNRTDLGKKSIQKRGNDIWNELPDEVKTIESFIHFKKLTKCHFLSTVGGNAQIIT